MELNLGIIWGTNSVAKSAVFPGLAAGCFSCPRAEATSNNMICEF